jgi:glycosyltransferase involved in cell wall biosynthesis
MISVTDLAINISVVITCYREGALLQEAVNSALIQSPQEIVIVNDASPDELTNRICRELELCPIITVIWQHYNGGPSVARNRGFAQARGDILVVLDADDLLPDGALEKIADAFSQDENIGFVCGSYLRQDRADRPAKKITPKNITLKTMLSAKQFSLSSHWQLLGTAPIRKSIWQKIGGYDPTFGAQDLHDVEFWIRVIVSGCHYATIDVPIYKWRKYLGSNSRKVTPLSWAQIAQKYFEIYQSLGLEFRAYELLLIGSKWQNDFNKTKFFQKKLFQCIKQGNYQLSTLFVLAIPTRLLQIVARRARRRR